MSNIKDVSPKFLPDLDQKWKKNLIIFDSFTLVKDNLKVTKLLAIKFLSSLTKMLFKHSLFRPFATNIWIQVGSKMARKIVFIPATLLPIQFSLKTKFLIALVS